MTANLSRVFFASGLLRTPISLKKLLPTSTRSLPASLVRRIPTSLLLVTHTVTSPYTTLEATTPSQLLRARTWTQSILTLFGKSSGCSVRTRVSRSSPFLAMVALLNGRWRRAWNSTSWCSWSERPTLTRRTCTLEPKSTRRPVEWPSLTQVVSPSTSPIRLRAMLRTSSRRRTAQSTSALCLTLSSTWRLTTVTLDLFIVFVAHLSGTRTSALFSWLALTIGLCVSGTPRTSKSTSAIRLSPLKSRLTISAGLLTHPPSSLLWPTTVVLKSGTWSAITCSLCFAISIPMLRVRTLILPRQLCVSLRILQLYLPVLWTVRWEYTARRTLSTSRSLRRTRFTVCFHLSLRTSLESSPRERKLKRRPELERSSTDLK